MKNTLLIFLSLIVSAPAFADKTGDQIAELDASKIALTCVDSFENSQSLIKAFSIKSGESNFLTVNIDGQLQFFMLSNKAKYNPQTLDEESFPKWLFPRGIVLKGYKCTPNLTYNESVISQKHDCRDEGLKEDIMIVVNEGTLQYKTIEKWNSLTKPQGDAWKVARSLVMGHTPGMYVYYREGELKSLAASCVLKTFHGE